MRKRSQARPQTQLERAVAEVRRLKESFPELAGVKDRLEVILGEAQNDPPEGASDGSIDVRTWEELRLVRDDLRDLLASTVLVRVPV